LQRMVHPGRCRVRVVTEPDAHRNQREGSSSFRVDLIS
jgi:hypothetical protein